MTKQEKQMEAQLRAEIAAWRAANKARHSNSFKTSFYTDKANRQYDWHASEERRQQLKRERGL